jgi:Ca2+-binding EF-hand superfamily protein
LEKHPDGRISQKDFSSMMQLCYPSTDIDKVQKHIFRVYDEDGDGWIDFKEFMMVLYIMSAGTPEENLGQIFRIFDKDNDGSISEKEMIKLVKDLCRVFEMASRDNDEEAGECQKLFKQNSKKNVALMAFKEMDKDSDGKITKEEFISACYKEKSVSNLFALKIVDMFIAK